MRCIKLRAANGQKVFFIDNNLNRFSDAQEGHGGFFLITVLFVLIGLLPFMSFLGEVVKQRKKVFEPPLVKFSAIVVLVFVVFFSVSGTKLPNYPMPCYPFAAIILGNFIALLWRNDIVAKKYPYAVLFAITLLLPVAGYIAVSHEVETKSVSSVCLLLFSTPLIFLVGFLPQKK